MKPEIGDRVVCTKSFGTRVMQGMQGTLLGTDSCDLAGVEWDELTNGHKLSVCSKLIRECKKGHGWLINWSRIEKIKYKSIYLYINMDTGDYFQSEKEPTAEDIQGVADGYLDILTFNASLNRFTIWNGGQIKYVE